MNDIAFFRPEFFWALSFIGIVILLHFLRHPKTVRMDFSSLRFFHNDAVRSNRTRKIRKILQLLTRISIVALLIFLFAAPYKNNDPSGNLHNPQCNVYCWVDPTMSMEYRQDQTSLGQKAHNLLDSLNRYLPASSRLFMYDHNNKKFNLKRNEFEQFKSSYKPLDMDNLFETVLSDKDFSSEQSLLLLFSDFQEPVTDKTDSLLKILPGQLTAICVPLTPHLPWNYSLKDVHLANEEKVQGTVCANGRDLAKGKLFCETGNMRTETTLLDIKKNECVNTQLRISSKGNLGGGKVVLEIDDPLQFDNVSFFAPQRQQNHRVLIVGNRQKNSVIASALNVSDKRWNPVILKDELDVTYTDLDSADIIIINSVSGISKQMDAFMAAYSGKEKALIRALDNSGGTVQASQSGNFALLNKVFKDISSGKSVRLPTPLTLVLPDTISDLWKGFPRMRSEEVAVYGYYNGIPGETLLHLGNGSGFMSQIKDRFSRNWIILSTPIGITEDNNLCETGFFVPFVDRICRYGIAMSSRSDNSILTGMPYRNPFYNSEISASVFDSDNRLILTLQNQSSVVFDQPGIYKIAPEGKKPYYLTVTIDPEESILSYRSPDTLKNSVNMSPDKLLSALNSRQSSFFWFLPWIILFCLIVLEVLLWERKRA